MESRDKNYGYQKGLAPCQVVVKIHRYMYMYTCTYVIQTMLIIVHAVLLGSAIKTLQGCPGK